MADWRTIAAPQKAYLADRWICGGFLTVNSKLAALPFRRGGQGISFTVAVRGKCKEPPALPAYHALLLNSVHRDDGNLTVMLVLIRTGNASRNT